MRLLPLAFLSLALPSTGCAGLIAASGRDPSSLTELQVRAEHPDAVAANAEDGTSLSFHSHEKIADRTTMYAMGYVITFGLGEVLWLPSEVYSAARRRLFGCDVCVVYHPTGKVKRVLVNGDVKYLGPGP